MTEYTLEEHIDVLDVSEGVALTVSPDPDTSTMVNIRTLSEKSKEFYGDLYISISPVPAMLLVKALKLSYETISHNNDISNKKKYQLVRRFRIYEENRGGFIEVSVCVDKPFIKMWTPIKDGQEYWGKFELFFAEDQAKTLAHAIEIVARKIEG